MHLSEAESIREVIAFPKTNHAVCPMTDAPGVVELRQMKELHIQWNVEPEKPEGHNLAFRQVYVSTKTILESKGILTC